MGYVIKLHTSQYKDRRNDYGFYCGRCYTVQGLYYPCHSSEAVDSRTKVYTSEKRAKQSADSVLDKCGYVLGYEIYELNNNELKVVHSTLKDFTSGINKETVKIHNALSEDAVKCESDSILLDKNEELLRYKEIGTVEEFERLKDRATAKEPFLIKRSIIQFYACPHCSNAEHYEAVYPQSKFCPQCGGSLNWEKYKKK